MGTGTAQRHYRQAIETDKTQHNRQARNRSVTRNYRQMADRERGAEFKLGVALSPITLRGSFWSCFLMKIGACVELRKL